MKIYFGKYYHHWLLLPAIKINFERNRYYKLKVLYFGIEIGWINRWIEIEIIKTYDKA